MIFHPEARLELQDAALFYERQQPGLGRKYLAAVASGLRQIERSPGTWRRLRGDLRRHLIRNFPYGIVYAEQGSEILIIAVMHCKRDPDYWVGRVMEGE